MGAEAYKPQSDHRGVLSETILEDAYMENEIETFVRSEVFQESGISRDTWVAFDGENGRKEATVDVALKECSYLRKMKPGTLTMVLGDAVIPVPDYVKPDKTEGKSEAQNVQKKTEKSEHTVEKNTPKPVSEARPSSVIEQVAVSGDDKTPETIASTPDESPQVGADKRRVKTDEYHQPHDEAETVVAVSEVGVADVQKSQPLESAQQVRGIETSPAETQEQADTTADSYRPVAKQIVNEVLPTQTNEVVDELLDPTDDISGAQPDGPLNEGYIAVESQDEFGVVAEADETLDMTDTLTVTLDEDTVSLEADAEGLESVISPETLELTEISPNATKLILGLVAIDSETTTEGTETEPSPINALVVERIMLLEGEQKEIVEELVEELMQRIESFDISAKAEVQLDQHVEMEELVYALFESLGIAATDEQISAFIGRLLKVRLVQQTKLSGELMELQDPGTYERRQYFAQARKNIATFFELPRPLKVGRFTLAMQNIQIVPDTA